MSSATKDKPAKNTDTTDTPPFTPYPKAFAELKKRMGATPEEIAAWVWFGPENNGLTAYLNPNEQSPPPKFFYEPPLPSSDNTDYLAPLMACWFKQIDIDQFQTQERFITGEALIERWQGHPGIIPKDFIEAKIAEGVLFDYHPICGMTQACEPENKSLPPMEEGLFELSKIKEVETIHFCCNETDNPNQEGEITPEVRPSEWFSKNASRASNARQDQPGGYRDLRKKTRDLWNTGKYPSKNKCAEDASKLFGLSYKTARNELIGA